MDPRPPSCVPVHCIKVHVGTDRVSRCPLSTPPLRLATQGTVSLSALRMPPGGRVAGDKNIYRMPTGGTAFLRTGCNPLGLNRIVQMAS